MPMSEHIWRRLEMGAAPRAWMGVCAWCWTAGTNAKRTACALDRQRQAAPQARADLRVCRVNRMEGSSLLVA
jgi:hypothetical protein